MMTNFESRHKLLFTVLGAVIGFSINYYLNKIQSDKLLASLTAQYNAILAAQHTARGSESAALEKKKSDLEAQIRLLTNK